MEHTITNYIVNPYYTLIVAVIVILLGNFVTKKFNFLSKYCIPEPISGGLIVSLVLLLVYYFKGIELSFNEPLKEFCMLAFFASIGLSADFNSLVKGGKPLVILTVVSTGLVILQNIVGVGSTYFFDQLQPLHGLLLGSIPLVGGPSTASSWSGWFESQYGLIGATTIGMTAATYGLVAGGIFGGPVASMLLKKVKKPTEDTIIEEKKHFITFESQNKDRMITAYSTLEVLALFAVCLSVAFFINDYLNTNFPDSKLRVPPFVWALFTGIILRNILTYFFKYDIFERNIDVLGNVSLSIFLAVALVSLKLWQLSGLGSIIIIILAVETIVSLLYIYYVTFHAMGRDYDAAVICAGTVGFGLGATPNAIANMQAITNKYGPSYKAFLIIPLVGAFFIDFINTLVLTIFQIILT